MLCRRVASSFLRVFFPPIFSWTMMMWTEPSSTRRAIIKSTMRGSWADTPMATRDWPNRSSLISPAGRKHTWLWRLDRGRPTSSLHTRATRSEARPTTRSTTPNAQATRAWQKKRLGEGGTWRQMRNRLNCWLQLTWRSCSCRATGSWRSWVR